MFDKTGRTVDTQHMGLTMKSRWLLVCGVIAGPLFIITFLILGSLRPDYSPVRDSVSALAVGEYGFLQLANFEITGLLILAFAIGLRHGFGQLRGIPWRATLFVILAVSMIGSGIFKTDVLVGHQAGMFTPPFAHSLQGALHVFFSISAFLVLAVACFVFAWEFHNWRNRGWSIYSVVSGSGMLLFLLLSVSGLDHLRVIAAYDGMLERMAIIIGLGWLSLLAVRLLRSAPAHDRRG